jgi:opacity protein-like surface antigen
MFGASAGYDHVFARWFLIGAEIDLALGDASGRLAGLGFNADYKASARARLGAFIHPSLLAYATFGAGWLGATLEKSLTTTTGVGDTSKALAGLTFGGGLEYDLGDFALFGEYLYADYASWNRPTLQAFNVDIESHTFRAGVKFKVGHDHTHGGYYADSVKDPRRE